MQITTPLALLVLSPLALAPSGDELAWAPKDGTQLTKDFVTTSTITLESMVMDMGGQAQENEGVEVAVETSARVTFTDTYSSNDERAPQSISREFTAITRTMDAEVIDGGDDASFENEAEHGLSGQTVVFKRDDDEWQASFPDGQEGKAEWLEGLTAEADLAAFLPEEKVAEGDSWKVDAESLLALLRPAGTALAMPDEVPDGADGEGATFCPFMDPAQAAEAFGGEVSVDWESTEEVDGARIATLKITADVTLESDATARLRDHANALGTSAEMPPFEEVSLSASWEAEGTVQWNLSTGLPHALEIGGDVVMEFQLAAEQNGMAMEVTLSLVGETSAELSTTTP